MQPVPDTGAGSPARLIDLSGRHVEPCREAATFFRQCLRAAVESTDLGEPTPPLGADRLRSALATTLDCEPGLVAVTAGVRAAVPLLAPLMPELTVEAPSFDDLPQLARALGCDVARLPWPDLQLEDSTAIWMTHPARNPDGARLSIELVQRLGRRRNLAVVNEVYRWSSSAEPVRPAGNVVAVGSLSKIWGPAARLGWIRGNVVTRLSKAALRISSAPLVMQHAWAAFLEGDGLRQLGEDAAAANAARRRFRDLLDPDDSDLIADGPSALVTVPRGVTAEDALGDLLSLGVKATNGRYFGAVGESLRFTFTGISMADAEFAAHACRWLFSQARTA